MIKPTLTIWMTLIAATYVAHAQQQPMPDMPGMNMPAAQQVMPATKPATPNEQKSLPDAMPEGVHSTSKSFEEQATQTNSRPDEQSDQRSITVPAQQLQEPEALDFHTGSDLPAPDLLADVIGRTRMTLEQFLDLADKTNPTLKQAQCNVDRSNAQARQAGLPPDPLLGYDGDHIRGGEYRGGEQGAFVTQEFVLGHKLALRRDIYRAEGIYNEYAVEVQRSRIHNDVARAFFDTVAAQQSVILHERLLKVALDTVTNTHELSRVGQADAAGILTAEVNAEQARIDFVNAQRLFLAHFAKLATNAGQPSLVPHPLQGDFFEPPALNIEEYVQRDIEKSPLIKRSQAEEATSEARLKDAMRERVPDLSVTAGEWYSGEPLGDGGKAGWEGFVQAGVQLPLWNRNQGNIATSKVLLDRAHSDVERTKLWTRNQTEPLAQQYMAAQFTAQRYRTEMIPRARRAYQLQVMKYQEMALAYPDVLAAQRLLFTLQIGYTDALNQEWQAAIALQNYALMDGLQEPASTGSDATAINTPTAAGGNP